MTVIISMLRGVNVGGNNMIKMEALRELYLSMKLKDAETHVNSGNVIFRTEGKDLVGLRKRIEDGIEKKFGFRVDVIFRTVAEWKEAIRRNPFSKRKGINPKALLVTFLAEQPGAAAVERCMKIKSDTEEMRIVGREVFIYYEAGMARPKISWVAIQKVLGTTGTGRNWNSVVKMGELAERMQKEA